MVMLKNCTACDTKHTPPYGKYCKFLKGKTMAKSAIPSRDDPAYLDYLEQELAAAKAGSLKEQDTMKSVLDRLEKLELTSVSQPVTTTASTPAVTSEPIVSMAGSASLSSTAGVGLRNPWSTPPLPSVVSTPWSAPPFRTTASWFPPTVNLTGSNLYPTSVSTASPWNTAYGLPPPPPGMHQRTSLGLPTARPSVVTAEVSSPLSSALEHLSQAIEPTIATSTKGILLKPEYYIQHVDQGTAIKSLDHTKLSYRDLMSGMSRVLEYLSTTGNAEATHSYLQHMIFLTKQASAHHFVDSAYVAYDRAVVDKVVKGQSHLFTAGDTLAVASHFHVGNLAPSVNNNKRQTGRGRGFRGRGRGSSFFDYDRESSAAVPDGFPTDICFNYNYRSCSGANCSKQHVCRQCKGMHRAQGCQEKPAMNAKK